MKECFHWKENDGMRIKATRSLLILALAFGAVFGMRSTSRAADPIKVGGAFALTGDAPSHDLPAANGAEFGFKKFGKTAYLLSDKGVEYTTLLGQFFKDRYTQLGGQLVLEDTYDDKATDFSAQITKLKALDKQPDFYYIAAMPYNVGPVVKQLRDAGLNGPVIGGDGYDTPDLVSVAGSAAENVFFSTHALMDKDNGSDGIKKFIAAYNKE